MLELLKTIQSQRAAIQKELEKEDQQLVFYRKFFSENNCTNTSSLSKANQLDLAVAIIMAGNPELDLEEVKQAVYGNRMIFEELDRDQADSVVRNLDLLERTDMFDYIKTSLMIGSPLKFSDLFTYEGRTRVIISEMIHALNSTPRDFVAFMNLFQNHFDSVGQAMATAVIIKEMERDRRIHHRQLQNYTEERGIKLKAKEEDRYVSKFIRDDWNISSIMQPIQAAKNYHHDKEQAQKSRQKSLARTLEQYDTLEKCLYEATQAGVEIKNIGKLLAKIPSEEVRMQALQLVYNHNKKIYDKATEEYEKLSANDSSHYQVLLAKYGISPSNYDVRTVMGNSLEDLSQMLEKLGKIQVTDPEVILRTIQQSDLRTITNYETLIEKGIITTELLHQQPGLFNPNSKDYEAFMRNLSLLQEKKINPRCLSSVEKTFVTPHTRFRQNITTLEDYALVGTMKSGMNSSFLAQPELASAIDLLIELGYEKNLEEHIELLNYAERFNRLKLLKCLNMPLTTTEELLEVLASDKFFVPDNAITDYIYNAVDHNLPNRITPLSEPKKKNPDVAKLTDYEHTLRAYSFDGILISKNKVARNLSMIATAGKTSDRLLYGVTKGSTLTDEEFATVATALSTKKAAGNAVNVK